MSSDGAKANRGQIDRLVTSLAQDVHNHTGGRGLPPKLIQTAVTVLSKDAAETRKDKLERVGVTSYISCRCQRGRCHRSQKGNAAVQDVQTARKAFSQTANGAQFEQHLQHLAAKG